VSATLLFVALVFPLKLALIDHLDLLALPIATLLAYLVANFGLYGIVFRADILKKLE
jgi:hypothetical protein